MNMKTNAQQADIRKLRTDANTSEAMLIDAIAGCPEDMLTPLLDRAFDAAGLSDETLELISNMAGRKPSERLRMGWVG